MTLSKQIKVSDAIGIPHNEMVSMGAELLKNGGSDYRDHLQEVSKKESEINDIVERLSDVLKSCDDGVIESIKGNLKLWEDLQMMRRNKPPKLG